MKEQAIIWSKNLNFITFFLENEKSSKDDKTPTNGTYRTTLDSAEFDKSRVNKMKRLFVKLFPFFKQIDYLSQSQESRVLQ